MADEKMYEAQMVLDESRELAMQPSSAMVLTDRQVIDRLVEGLRANALALDADDALTLVEAEMSVTDKDDYARGFEVLSALRALDDRIKEHYLRFKGPLNELANVVRSLEQPQASQIITLKKTLSDRLTAWKQAEERRMAAEREQAQRVADEAARAAAVVAAAELESVAATVPDPMLAEAMRMEAEMVRTAPVAAAPVALAEAAPKAAGHTRKAWKGRIDDIDVLLKAHVEGKCHLPVETIAEALASFMDAEARQHQQHLPRVYPGVSSYNVETAVTPRRSRVR